MVRTTKQEIVICFILNFTFACGAKTIKVMVKPVVTEIAKINPHASQEGNGFTVNYTKQFTLWGAGVFYIFRFED